MENARADIEWTIRDFQGNTVRFRAGADLQDALDTASDDEHREQLYGNPEHWDITGSDGQHYPQQSQYDWDRDELGYTQ